MIQILMEIHIHTQQKNFTKYCSKCTTDASKVKRHKYIVKIQIHQELDVDFRFTTSSAVPVSFRCKSEREES